MEKSDLIEKLKNGNAYIWTTFVNTISQLDRKTIDRLQKDDEEYIHGKASTFTGRLSTTLTELFMNACDNIRHPGIDLRIEENFYKISDKIEKMVEPIENYCIGIDLYLKFKGYKGDTPSLAYHSVVDCLRKDAEELGPALETTIDTLSESIEEQSIQDDQIFCKTDTDKLEMAS